MNTTNTGSLNRMAEKLLIHGFLSIEDQSSLVCLPYSVRSYEAGSYLLRTGDMPDQCKVILSGLAYRHKISVTGLRQIVAIHIPGEILDLHQMYVDVADSNVQALNQCKVATISHTRLRQLVAERPSVGNALFASTIVDLSLSREWILNIGRRDARTRIAHFLCEFALRLGKHKLPAGQACELPMTQEQLGDVLGLTAIHVNRTLKGLVQDGLIERNKQNITIPNWGRLVQEADFNSHYLHLNT